MEILKRLIIDSEKEIELQKKQAEANALIRKAAFAKMEAQDRKELEKLERKNKKKIRRRNQKAYFIFIIIFCILIVFMIEIKIIRSLR